MLRYFINLQYVSPFLVGYPYAEQIHFLFVCSLDLIRGAVLVRETHCLTGTWGVNCMGLEKEFTTGLLCSLAQNDW